MFLRKVASQILGSDIAGNGSLFLYSPSQSLFFVGIAQLQAAGHIIVLSSIELLLAQPAG